MSPKEFLKFDRTKLVCCLFAAFVYPLSGCGTIPKQSPLMLQQKKVFRISATELHIRIQQMAYRFSDVIEEAANQIMAESSDPMVRRNALLWKMNAIPAAYTAVFQSEPLVALLDAWVFAVQMGQYFEAGRGKDAFGEHHTIALNASRELEAEIEDLARSVSPTGDISSIKGDVHSWALEHPIESPLFARKTTVTEFADVLAKGAETLGVVGRVTFGIDELATRISLYNEFLPRQARWQAEFLLAESNAQDGVKVNVDGVAELAKSLDRVLPIIEQAPELVTRERAAAFKAIREERIATLNSIGVQRVATLNWLTKERVALTDALQGERVATLATLREERIASLREIEAIGNRVIVNSITETKGLIDHFVWRSAQLLVVLVIACFIVGVYIVRIAKK